MAQAITGVALTAASIRQAVKDLEEKAVREVRDATLQALRTAMSRTPVWSGESVRNYRIGVNGQVPGGTISPIDNGPPGPTNSMAIGDEPRRGPNESAAYGEAVGRIDSKKLQNYVLTNTLPSRKWDMVDSGFVPGGPNQVSRGPGGYMKLAQQTVRQRGHWK